VSVREGGGENDVLDMARIMSLHNDVKQVVEYF
jgi:hypothetical protein